MLPARSRVRTRDDHARVGSAGRRARSGPLVVHSLWTADGAPARAGFVVGRRVGQAVVRNRVRRRLREQVRTRLDGLPAGTLVVVRALPGAADASSEELGAALEQAFERATGPRATPGAVRAGATGPPPGTSGRGGR